MKRNNKAFTLVEVLVASILMMVSITTILGAVGDYSKKPVVASGDLAALVVAQKFLTDQHTLFTSANWQPGGIFSAKTGTIPSSYFSGLPSTYSGTYTITNDPPTCLDLTCPRKLVVTVVTPP